MVAKAEQRPVYNSRLDPRRINNGFQSQRPRMDFPFPLYKLPVKTNGVPDLTGDQETAQRAKAEALQDREVTGSHRMESLKDRQVLVFDRLLHITDPDGNRFTIGRAAAAVGHPEQWGTRRVRERHTFRTEYPKVKEEPLAKNEQAFFMGLAANDTFQVKRVKILDREYITVATEATRNAKRKAVIRQIFGTWGEIRETKDETRVYLHSPTFDFMQASVVNSDFLRAKALFAPFLRGFMLTRKTENNFIRFPDKKLLINLNKWFEVFFDLPLDDFFGKGRVDTNYLKLTSPEKVMAALEQEKSVQTLPFYKELVNIENLQKEQEATMATLGA